MKEGDLANDESSRVGGGNDRISPPRDPIGSASAHARKGQRGGNTGRDFAREGANLDEFNLAADSPNGGLERCHVSDVARRARSALETSGG